MDDQTYQHDVPHRVQLNGETCVPTCLGMLMDHFGRTVEQAEIDSVARTNGLGITGSHRGILETAVQFGFSRAQMAYVPDLAPRATNFLLSLLKTQPVLLTGKFHHFPELAATSGHAVVPVGYSSNRNLVIFHDPHHVKATLDQGKRMAMDVDEFVNRWALLHKGWILWLRDDIREATD